MRRSRPFSITFSIARPDIPRIQSLFPSEKGATAEAIEEAWFDTPGHDLRRSGLTLSIATAGGHRWQRARPSPGDHADAAWRDHKTDAAEPDRDALPEILSEIVGDDAPKAVFEIKATRRRRALTGLGRGVAVDMTFDEGTMMAAGADAAVNELRFDLVAGRPLDVFSAARKIAGENRMRIDFATRVERGYRLADGAWGKPSGKAPSGIRGRMNTVEAFGVIARACLSQFSLNWPSLDGAQRMEAVHQARVSIRRLRSALSLFGKILRDDTFDRLRGELKWFFDCLGEARDLDVHAEFLQTNAPPPGTEDAATIETRRREAHARLDVALASERLDTMLLDLAEWIETGAWRLSRDATQARYRGLPVGDYAAKRLTKRRKAFKGLVERFGELSPTETHDLRIQTKKLRYIAEFLEPLARHGKARKRYESNLKKLSKLQETLGELHDLDERAASLVPENAAEPIAVDGARREDLMRRAARQAEAAARAKPFWTLI
jgi:triphosphatase